MHQKSLLKVFFFYKDKFLYQLEYLCSFNKRTATPRYCCSNFSASHAQPLQGIAAPFSVHTGRSATRTGLSSRSLPKSALLPKVIVQATTRCVAKPSRPHHRLRSLVCVLKRTLLGRPATHDLAAARTKVKESLPHRPKTSTPKL